MDNVSTRKVWKKVKLGTEFRTGASFQRALNGKGFRIGMRSSNMLGDPGFSVSPRQMSVELVVLTTAELTGENTGSTTAEVFLGIERLGFNKCSAEVGPQLRLQYRDQPYGEWLFIAMDPINDSGTPLIFAVSRNGSGLWLHSYRGGPQTLWSAGSRWVVVRPRA